MKSSSTNPALSDDAIFIDKQSELIAIIDELAAARSLDDLCLRAVLAATQRLGFERIGIWFLEDDGQWNAGTFGVDETGGIRDERGVRHRTSDFPILPASLNKRAISIHLPDAELYNDSGQVIGRGAKLVGFMRKGEQLIGFVSVDNFFTRKPFPPYAERLLNLYTSLIGNLITLKRTEDALRFSEELLQTTLNNLQTQAHRLRSVVDAMPAGVLLLDQRMHLLVANALGHGYLRQVGRLAQDGAVVELGGRPTIELLLQIAGLPSGHEYSIDGDDRRNYALLCQPTNPADPVSDWVLLVRDVTAERQIQERLQAQERLAAVGHLAAGIAHDFNNIVSVITLYAQLLRHGGQLDPVDYERVTVIEQQSVHARNLIRQVLDFSRRSVIQLEPVDLGQIVAETVRMVQRTLPESIEMNVAIDDKRHIIDGDAGQIQQALMNLVVNARDAMPDGGRLSIRLSSHHVPSAEQAPVAGMAAGDWYVLEVEDTGAGIEPEHLARIFDPFFTTKPHGKGSGLGLAQVYGIVHQHKAQIAVRSQPAAGACFSLYFSARTGVPTKLDLPGVVATDRDGHFTILLVEDNETARNATCAVLDMLGYQVIVASHGREALDCYLRKECRVDLVLSDLVMPEMSGQELYRELRERQETVRMVIMTGYPLEDGGRNLLEMGIVAWLQKPFSVEQLEQKLHEVLHG
jgi:signal transduction histidine kinase